MMGLGHEANWSSKMMPCNRCKLFESKQNMSEIKTTILMLVGIILYLKVETRKFHHLNAHLEPQISFLKCF
jgi:hypothetical protein